MKIWQEIKLEAFFTTYDIITVLAASAYINLHKPWASTVVIYVSVDKWVLSKAKMFSLENGQ